MASAVDQSHPLLGALVDRAQRRAGSKMSAYSDVGRTIGVTGSWVRKFLGRQPVRLDADTFLNIQAAYARECERWEAEAELQRKRFFALGRGTDAMDQGETGRVDVPQSGRSSRKGQTTALVAQMVDEVRR